LAGCRPGSAIRLHKVSDQVFVPRPARVAALAFVCLVRAGLAAAGPAASPPRLIVRAPLGYESMVARVEGFDLRRLVNVMRLVGLEQPGRPIPVDLVPDDSPEARRHPAWIAGYTVGGIGPIVLFPDRALAYPHDSLEDVLHHEVAHVLIARAARGRPLPRWFNEGAAMAAEHTWGLADDTRVSWDLLWRNPVPLSALDEMFREGPDENRRAYALSGALVHDLLERAGPMAVARVLAGIASGASFGSSFADVAGEPPEQAAASLWQRRTVWVRWVPLLTSSGVLWMGVTLLALYAIRRRRQRRAELRRKWEAEEGGDGGNGGQGWIM
jgi:hypothetical protein